MKKLLTSVALGTSLLAASLTAQTQPMVTPLPPRPTGITNVYQGGHTLGHYVLDAEQAMGATKEDYQKLEKIIKEATQRIQGRPTKTAQDGRNILERIGITLMLNDYKSATSKGGNVDLFHETLRTKEMDCETSAFLYMSVADHAHLPLHAVVNHPAYKKGTNGWQAVQGHVFVRWRVSDKEYFNWEGRHNKELPDSWYEKNLGKPRPLKEYEIKQGLWQEKRFQEMDVDRFTWWALQTRAEFGHLKINKDWWIVKGDIMKQALAWNTRKARDNQRNPEQYLIRGDIERELYNFNDALTNYEHALTLHPNLELTQEAYAKRNHCWTIIEQVKNQVNDK